MKARSLILGLVLTCLLTACGQQSAPGKASSDTSADAIVIRTGVGKFVDAWNKGDLAAYGPQIAMDAIMDQPDGPPLQGRAAIMDSMAKDIDITKAQQTSNVDEVIVMGDHAYARGTWNVTPIATAGADAKPANGKWSVLFTRGADGAWSISRWMWSQEAAPKAGG